MFLMTKMGYLNIFYIHTGKIMHSAERTAYAVSVTCAQESTGAMFGITVRLGEIFHVQMNGDAYFIS